MTPVEWSFQLITSITPANISIMVRRFIYLQLLYYVACGTKVRERASERDGLIFHDRDGAIWSVRLERAGKRLK